MTIGDRIKTIRGSLSQKNFALKISSGQKSIHAWESGKASPGAGSLKRIHQVFGVDLNWLITGEGEMYMKDTVQKGSIRPGPGAAIYKDRWKDAMVRQPSEPAYTAERNAGIDPFARAVAGLREIYDSADPVLIPAIESNIIAFQVVVRRDKEIQAQHREIETQKARIAKLEEECEEMRRSMNKLEEIVRGLGKPGKPEVSKASKVT